VYLPRGVVFKIHKGKDGQVDYIEEKLISIYLFRCALTLNVSEKLEKSRKPAHKCSKALENELN